MNVRELTRLAFLMFLALAALGCQTRGPSPWGYYWIDEAKTYIRTDHMWVPEENRSYHRDDCQAPWLRDRCEADPEFAARRKILREAAEVIRELDYKDYRRRLQFAGSGGWAGPRYDPEEDRAQFKRRQREQQVDRILFKLERDLDRRSLDRPLLWPAAGIDCRY